MADEAGSTAVKSKKELIVNVTPTSQVAMQIGTQSQNTDPGTRAPNIGFSTEAYGSPNSDDDIALRVPRGNTQIGGELGQNRVITIDGGNANWHHIKVVSGFITNYVITNNSDNPF